MLMLGFWRTYRRESLRLWAWSWMALAVHQVSAALAFQLTTMFENPGHPMRVAAGFVGGVWLTHYLADLGFDRFDGAWLAQNFESLKPETAVWDKYANLFTHVDTEQQRFLDFERWWNGFYRLSGEEMV